ncbi:MAG: type II toxin-antitoxin system VapC family toxin [Opitutaceae bacterium]|tara:strand:+ start:928 stop:1341 length:414 start_codon:yes stop_codon:yes gene_type:complete
MSILLDTNVVSELARPRPDLNVIRYCASLPHSFLSVITLHELWHGAHLVKLSKKRERLLKWVGEIEQKFAPQILPISTAIASTAAEMRAGHAAQGLQLHIEYALIAATVREHKLTLATRNLRDFSATGVSLVNPWGT